MLKHQSLFAIIAASIIATGCAAPYKPVIDSRGADMAKYEQDWLECKRLAITETRSAGDAAAGGALMGALLGVVIGKVLDPRGSSGQYAGAGAIGGAAGSSVRNMNDYHEIARNCMRGRNWNVLR